MTNPQDLHPQELAEQDPEMFAELYGGTHYEAPGYFDTPNYAAECRWRATAAERVATPAQQARQEAAGPRARAHQSKRPARGGPLDWARCGQAASCKIGTSRAARQR